MAIVSFHSLQLEVWRSKKLWEVWKGEVLLGSCIFQCSKLSKYVLSKNLTSTQILGTCEDPGKDLPDSTSHIISVHGSMDCSMARGYLFQEFRTDAVKNHRQDIIQTCRSIVCLVKLKNTLTFNKKCPGFFWWLLNLNPSLKHHPLQTHLPSWELTYPITNQMMFLFLFRGIS